MPQQPYRLSIDMGTNSIGWAILDLDDGTPPHPVGLRDLGVRVFSDSRTGTGATSLAAERRRYRSARRRRRRALTRRDDLEAALVDRGLWPDDEKEVAALLADQAKVDSPFDPYRLRAEALERPLVPYELGRALLHLNKRRGFASNRKVARKDEDAGVIRAQQDKLTARMDKVGARTLGQYLWRRRRKGKPVRFKKDSGVYPTRQMYHDEFTEIRKGQATHHPSLTDTDWDDFEIIIFRQRGITPPSPGQCSLDPEREKRAPWALPLAQRFRIAQEVAHLRIKKRGGVNVHLSASQRRAVRGALARSPRMTFAEIKTLLGLPRNVGFTHETTNRRELKGDETAAILGSPELFGEGWFKRQTSEQDKIVRELLDEDDETIRQLATTEWGLSEDTAQAFLEPSLPSGYANIGPTAMGRLLSLLEADKPFGDDDETPMDFKTAADRLYPPRPIPLLPKLPYYAEVMPDAVWNADPDNGKTPEEVHGRITNSTVHVALNQLRRVVNEVIDRHGPPAEIHVELARELKNSPEEVKRYEARIARNRRENEKIDEIISQHVSSTRGNRRANRLRYRLWEEQGGVCIYSGEEIALDELFTKATEMDHIMPWDDTLDDGRNNLVVCRSSENVAKDKRTPWDAFATDAARWDAILDRVDKLKKAKRWPQQKADRFSEEAALALREMKERGEEPFLKRQLTDTQYVSRLARRYLCHVCPENRVRSSPGRLTWMVRNALRINKTRNDHRHHAADAVVIGLIDRSLLQGMSTLSGRGQTVDEEGLRTLLERRYLWPDFRDQFDRLFQQIVVSHKPDHGIAGGLHDDTRYGVIQRGEEGQPWVLRYRRKLEAVKPEDVSSILSEIIDQPLKRRIEAWLDTETPKVAARLAEQGRKTNPRVVAFNEFAIKQGIHAAKCRRRETAVPLIMSPNGLVLTAVRTNNNDRIELFRVRLKNGKERWRYETITKFDANRPGFVAGWRSLPNAEPVMVLRKNDMIIISADGKDRVMYVRKFDRAGNILLADHFESRYDKAARKQDKDAHKAHFKVRGPEGLRKLNARRVRVSPGGALFVEKPFAAPTMRAG